MMITLAVQTNYISSDLNMSPEDHIIVFNNILNPCGKFTVEITCSNKTREVPTLVVILVHVYSPYFFTISIISLCDLYPNL